MHSFRWGMAFLLLAGVVTSPTYASADEPDGCFDGASIMARSGVLTSQPAQVKVGVRKAYCDDVRIRVQRADGTNAQIVLCPYFDEYAPNEATYGIFHAPVANGAGTWLVTHVYKGDLSYELPTPFAFLVQRGARMTVPQSLHTLPGHAVTITGTASYYTSTGRTTPMANRPVDISARNVGSLDPEHKLLRLTTDSAGRFRYTIRPTRSLYLNHRVWSHNAVISNQLGTTELLVDPHPTTIDGFVGPTNSAVIHPGTRMSTYGHLKVMFDNGSVGPYAGRLVEVQTRPKSDPTAPYRTVATATTTSTGYYYTNWNASVDADVRVAFISPYKTIASVFRYLRAIDVV